MGRPASVLLFLAAVLSPGVAPASRAGGDVERGRYLALHVSLCVFCHSEIDWKADGFPPRTGAAGAGRAAFSDALPWLPVPNLTPDPETGIGRWTDEQLDRAIRRGIGHDGRVLHPAMPSHSYRAMSGEDAASIIAYLRTLEPVRRRLPPPDIPPDVRASLRAPEPPTSALKAGEYLAALAACGHCHTPADERGQPIPGLEFAGGTRLKGPWGDLHAPNITPDASGIECIGETGFVHAMKTGELPGRTLNGVMPWGHYRRMTDEDLRTLYGYVMALPPVRHFIDNSVAPTPCRKCGRPHGLGNRN